MLLVLIFFPEETLGRPAARVFEGHRSLEMQEESNHAGITIPAPHRVHSSHRGR